MPNIERIPGKIFAENASPVGNNPEIGKFGNAKQGIYTGEADVQEIQNSDAWSQGWTSAVVSAMNYPPLPEMNGVLKVLSYQICYLLQKGIPEWNADTIYYKNDYVNYNGKLYYSDIDNNTFEPETREAGNSWLSGTSDVRIATNETNGISRPDGETITITDDGVLSVKGIPNPFNLFDYRYSEYPLYNASWLLADGSYKNKSLYPTAYEALVIEQDGTKSAGETYDLPSGGKYLKRGLPVKVSTISYTDYDFVIDVENETFRLPMKTDSMPISPTIKAKAHGNDIALGLTDGEVNLALNGEDISFGSTLNVCFGGNADFYGQAVGTPAGNGDISYKIHGITKDADKSGIVVDLTNTISPKNNLYFYIGDSVQNLSTIDAGNILENCVFKTQLVEAQTVIETYTNGASGYRIWSDGYCEQWGTVPVDNNYLQILYLIPFKDNNYFLSAVSRGNDNDTGGYADSYVGINGGAPFYYGQNATGFRLTTYSGNMLINWLAMGYLAEGTY